MFKREKKGRLRPLMNFGVASKVGFGEAKMMADFVEKNSANFLFDRVGSVVASQNWEPENRNFVWGDKGVVATAASFGDALVQTKKRKRVT